MREDFSQKLSTRLCSQYSLKEGTEAGESKRKWLRSEMSAKASAVDIDC